MELVIVERIYPSPLTQQGIDDMRRRLGPCFDLRRITWQRTYISRDRMHTICLYQAPDAGTVRDAHDQQGVAYERIWSADEVNELPGL